MRGVALSAPATEDDYEVLRPFLGRVIAQIVEMSHLKLVNVNFPAHPRDVLFTRQSVRHYDGIIVPAEDPQGREIFWFALKPLEPAEPGTDRWAVENDYVSITPLRLDLTDHEALKALAREKPRVP
jgi:5'-nucleotidase